MQIKNQKFGKNTKPISERFYPSDILGPVSNYVSSHQASWSKDEYLSKVPILNQDLLVSKSLH